MSLADVLFGKAKVKPWPDPPPVARPILDDMLEVYQVAGGLPPYLWPMNADAPFLNVSGSPAGMLYGELVDYAAISGSLAQRPYMGKVSVIESPSSNQLSTESLVDEIMERMYGQKCGKAVIPCQHCGQWGARMCSCRHCGGPVEALPR